jgi:hypothetical protein
MRSGGIQELVPLVSGFGLGVALGVLRPTSRGWFEALPVVALGVMATVVTGEFKVSWAFVLIDIPLVAMAALCGLLVARQAARRMLGTG